MLSTAVFHTVDETTGGCLSVSSDSLLAEKLAMPSTSAVIISILSDRIIDNRVSGSSNSKFSSISIPGIASGWTGELPVRPEDVESKDGSAVRVGEVKSPDELTIRLGGVESTDKLAEQTVVAVVEIVACGLTNSDGDVGTGPTSAFGMMVLIAFSGISSPDPSVGVITAVTDGLELVDGTGFSVATAGSYASDGIALGLKGIIPHALNP